MLPLLTGLQLVAYVFCIHVALRCAYRLYWVINDKLFALPISTFSRCVLGCLVASLPFVGAVGITIIFAFADSVHPLSALGLSADYRAAAFVSAGAAIGFICVILAAAGGSALGCLSVGLARRDEQREYLPRFFVGLMDFFSGSLFEEIVVRGYIYYVLTATWGALVGIVGSSLVFSLAHYTNGGKAPMLFSVNAFIFGLIAAYCRWQTGALWLPIGLHFGWNLAACPLLGLPHGGENYCGGVMRTSVTGPQWFTGGAYSPDAGLLGTLALCIAFAAVSTVALAL